MDSLGLNSGFKCFKIDLCCFPAVPAMVKEMGSAGLAPAWVGEVQKMLKWAWQRAGSSEQCVMLSAGKAISSWLCLPPGK